MSLIIVDENRNEDVLTIQRLLNDSLDELELIAEGSTAIVYKYKDLAVKVLKTNEFKEKDLYLLSWREAEGLHRLRELDCVPKIIALKESEFIVMEYVQGELLEDIQDETRLKNISQQVKAFKEYCAMADMYPRDLYSHNIIVRPGGTLTFIDLGYYSVTGIEDWDWESNWEDFNLQNQDIQYEMSLKKA